MSVAAALPLSQTALDTVLAEIVRQARRRGHAELGLLWWPNGCVVVECRACQASELVRVVPMPPGDGPPLPADGIDTLRRYRCLYASCTVVAP